MDNGTLYNEMLNMVHEGIKEVHKIGLESIQTAETLEAKMEKCNEYAKAMTELSAMLSTVALMKPYPTMGMMMSNYCAGNGNS